MKKGRKLILCLLAGLVMCQSVPVQAAGKTEILLKAKQDDKNEKQLEVSCYISEGEGITNGKLRVFYNEDQVKLVSCEKGEVLQDGMCEINDCLSGNKQEGELVAAFASAQALNKNGNLLEMKFELKDGLDDSDEIEFQVRPEKLSGDNGNLSAEEARFIFVLGKAGEQTSENKKDDNDNSKNPLSNSKNAGKVKTGDDTEIAKYLTLGGGTLLVLLVCAKSVAKKDKTNH